MKQILKLFLSLAILFGAIYFLDWDTLENSLFQLNALTFFIGTIVAFMQYLANAIRWHLLVKNFSNSGALNHVGHYLYASFLNTFTPSNVGGDVYRYISLRQKDTNNAPIIIALVRERILGIFACLMIYVFCLGGILVIGIETQWNESIFFLYAGGFALAGGAGIVFLPKLLHCVSASNYIQTRNGLLRLFATIQEAFDLKSFLGVTNLMALSLLALFIWIVTIVIFSIDLEFEISWLLLGAIILLVEIIRMIPITIQGIGVREGMYAYLFAISGKVPETGFILATVSYIALSLSLLLSGFIGWVLMYLFPMAKKSENKTEME